VIKSHGGTTGVYVDGNPQGMLFHDADNYTAYVSPYLVVSNDRFTKHYYTGTQRVASKIGVGKFNNLYLEGGSNITAGQKDYAARMALIEKYRGAHYATLGIPPGPPTSKGIYGEPEYNGKALPNGVLGNYDIPARWPQPPVKNKPGEVPGPPVMYGPSVKPDDVQPPYGYDLPVPIPETDIYFYHSDHLGSTSYITDAEANPTQFVCYMPFGAAFVDEHTTRPEMPYKFNGKEQDGETGLYYYGARYYDAMIAVWYGVDPLVEKYPNMGGYVYCANNPVKFIDPDGKVIVPVHGTWSNKNTWKDLAGIANACGKFFGDNNLGARFEWSGGNYSKMRTSAAKELVNNVRAQLAQNGNSEPVTLVGHSHGGNVSIEAINLMVEMDEFKDVKFNLLTINTPVRKDYQLSEKAQNRVTHVNVYDTKDPVQSNGGKSTIVLPDNPSNAKLTGEYGTAGRIFNNAINLEVDNPQGFINGWALHGGVKWGDYHNSHNRVYEWIDKAE
jgi:RHS repeat-associated protein